MAVKAITAQGNKQITGKNAAGIGADPDELDIRAAAIMEGMETMFENGLRKSLAGLTTIEEVLRVTRED